MSGQGWTRIGATVPLVASLLGVTGSCKSESGTEAGSMNSSSPSTATHVAEGGSPTTNSTTPIAGGDTNNYPAATDASGSNPSASTSSSATGGNSATSALGGATSAGGQATSATGSTVGAGGVSMATLCGTFPTKPTQTGSLFTGGLEASGMVASRKQPGVFWMHGDSSPILYAIDSTGKRLGQWEVTSSGRFFFIYNWEDIAIESVPSGPDRIWIGDIGNHTADAAGNPVEPRANLRLLSIDEPSVDPMQVVQGTIKVTSDLTFDYPDGLFDSEALMIDPATNDFFVVSKTAAAPSKIYRIAAPIAGNRLQYIGNIEADSINGGDISPSGRELLLRNYSYVYYWARPSGKAWYEVLTAEPSIPDKKSRITFTQNYFSEAVSFAPDESGFYAISEEQPDSGVAPSPVEFYPKNCN